MPAALVQQVWAVALQAVALQAVALQAVALQAAAQVRVAALLEGAVDLAAASPAISGPLTWNSGSNPRVATEQGSSAIGQTAP